MAMVFGNAPPGFMELLQRKYDLMAQENASRGMVQAAQADAQTAAAEQARMQTGYMPMLTSAQMDKYAGEAEADRARAALLGEQAATSRELRLTKPSAQEAEETQHRNDYASGAIDQKEYQRRVNATRVKFGGPGAGVPVDTTPDATSKRWGVGAGMPEPSVPTGAVPNYSPRMDKPSTTGPLTQTSAQPTTAVAPPTGAGVFSTRGNVGMIQREPGVSMGTAPAYETFSPQVQEVWKKPKIYGM